MQQDAPHKDKNINYSYIKTWDQAMSKVDNRKICCKDYDKACTDVELWDKCKL
jgi:hypothetical protein